MNKFQKELDGYFKKEGWDYWHPLAQFTRLIEETGELARILNHLYGEKPKKASELEQDLEDEIGDVIYTLICLGNSTGVDLDKAARRSLNKVAKRDKGRYGKSTKS
ncbi:MAG: nucleotide pyrophosphohydrolase [Patescibacteria group bacterium]|jgi:NTP pyrophosphatase (non-canonical NTP hydrolase)